MTAITPIHPGLILQDEMEERGISQTDLAKHIDVLPKSINEIAGGKRSISPIMAWKLSKAFGTSPQFWMNLQNNWELSRLKPTERKQVDQITVYNARYA
jgi:addiction module HigA family antidote